MDKEEQVTTVTVIMMLNSHDLFTMKGIFAKKIVNPYFCTILISLLLFL